MWDLATREMSRVYHRQAHRVARAETRMSVVVPVGNSEVTLEPTLESAALAEPDTLELIVLFHGDDHQRGKSIRRQVLEAQRKVAANTVRYVRIDPCDVFTALTQAVDAVRSPLVTFLSAGDRIPHNWTSLVEEEFRRDNVAILLPYGHKPEVRAQFRLENEKDGFLSVQMPLLGLRIFCQTLSLASSHSKNLEASKHPGTGAISPLLAFRHLLLRTLYKGWAILAETQLQLPQATPALSKAQEALECCKCTPTRHYSMSSRMNSKRSLWRSFAPSMALP